MHEFSTLDFLIIGGYLALVLIFGLFIKTKGRTATDYFLAGRNTGWFVVGAGMFASNFGSEHVLGNTKSGFDSGLVAGHFEWLACIILVFMSWFIVPFLVRSKVFTVPEFIEKRFDARSRYYLSIISILAYIITKISVTLFAGGIILKGVLGWDLYSSALLFTLGTGAYTIIGGLRAVLYTEAIQSLIIVVGTIIFTIVGINKIGGVDVLVQNTPDEFWSMFKPMSDPDFPWTGIMFGAPILAIWYWCTDQYIVQKVLSARNVKVARRGVIFAGYLKLIPVFGFMVSGMVISAMHPDIPEGMNPYSFLITEILPYGLRGLAIAVLLAALMSSLAASFSSASTLFTFDIYQKIYPKSTDFQLYSIGRIVTFAIVIFGILWVPFISNFSDDIIKYLQSIQAYISPPIAAIFLVGIFWKRATGSAAFLILVVGGILGTTRFVLEQQNITFDIAIIDWMVHMNFLHFAILLFGFSVIFMVVISYMTRYDRSRSYENLTFKMMDKDVLSLKSMESYRLKNLIASIVLILVVCTLWYIFF